MNERSVRRPHALDPGHDLPLLDNSNGLPGPVAIIIALPHRRLHLPEGSDQNGIVGPRRQMGRNERNSLPTLNSAMVKDDMSDNPRGTPHKLGLQNHALVTSPGMAQPSCRWCHRAI